MTRFEIGKEYLETDYLFGDHQVKILVVGRKGNSIRFFMSDSNGFYNNAILRYSDPPSALLRELGEGLSSEQNYEKLNFMTYLFLSNNPTGFTTELLTYEDMLESLATDSKYLPAAINFLVIQTKGFNHLIHRILQYIERTHGEGPVTIQEISRAISFL